MTVHRFPEKKHPPKVDTSDIEFARSSLEEAEYGKANIASDIEHHKRILKTVGPRLSEGVRARLAGEIAGLQDLRAEAEAEAAVWHEVVRVLIAQDGSDDRPDPDVVP